MRLPPRQSTAEADLMVPFQLVRLGQDVFTVNMIMIIGVIQTLTL